jgi:hypothetical protein
LSGDCHSNGFFFEPRLAAATFDAFLRSSWDALHKSLLSCPGPAVMFSEFVGAPRVAQHGAVLQPQSNPRPFPFGAGNPSKGNDLHGLTRWTFPAWYRIRTICLPELQNGTVFSLLLLHQYFTTSFPQLVPSLFWYFRTTILLERPTSFRVRSHYRFGRRARNTIFLGRRQCLPEAGLTPWRPSTT